MEIKRGERVRKSQKKEKRANVFEMKVCCIQHVVKIKQIYHFDFGSRKPNIHGI